MKNYAQAKIDNDNEQMLANAIEMAEAMGRDPKRYRPLFAMQKNPRLIGDQYNNVLYDYVSKQASVILADNKMSRPAAMVEVYRQMGVNARNRFGDIVEVEGIDY